MFRAATTFALTAALAVGAGHTGYNLRADDKKGDAKTDAPRPQPTAESKAADALVAAYTMARLGKEAKSPEMLLAAARVIGTTDVKRVDMKDAKIQSAVSDVDPLAEATALIAEARKLGGDNADAVTKLAAAVEKDIKEFKRGVIGGPRSWTGRVDAKYDKNDQVYLEYRGGQQGTVRVTNTTNAGDIDLFVYDLDNRLVASDRRTDDDAFVSFYVPKNSRYRIVIQAYAGPNKPLVYRVTTN